MTNKDVQYVNILARCVASSPSASVMEDVSDHQRCTVKNENISKYVKVPSDLLEGNGFRVGSEVHLCGICYPNGNILWVPDQRFYPKNCYSERMSLGAENASTEFKRSLIHIANRDIDDPVTGNKPAQYKVIAKEIAGMVTARSRNAVVYIGCDDYGHPLGLNDEVTNKVAAECDLRNYLSQIFSNISFVSSLVMSWLDIDGKLVLRIDIPEYHGDILMVGQTEVYYRNGSNTTRVKGAELINLIRNYNNN